MFPRNFQPYVAVPYPIPPPFFTVQIQTPMPNRPNNPFFINNNPEVTMELNTPQNLPNFNFASPCTVRKLDPTITSEIESLRNKIISMPPLHMPNPVSMPPLRNLTENNIEYSKNMAMQMEDRPSLRLIELNKNQTNVKNMLRRQKVLQWLEKARKRRQKHKPNRFFPGRRKNALEKPRANGKFAKANQKV